MKKTFLVRKIAIGLAIGAVALPNCVWALPQGGQIVAGNGQSPSVNGNVMDINGSGNISMKWDNFSIDANEVVNFNGMQAILNYVTGKQGSEIYGKINGAGVNVFLINPNGILFGKTAEINVGSLIASTKNLDDVDNVLNNFKTTGVINDFGSKSASQLINMGKLEADSLYLEGGRIILDTDNVKLAGRNFDGSNAFINGDYDNDNVILGHTAYTDGSYANQDKYFAVNNGDKNILGYMWVADAEQLQAINTNLQGRYALKNDIDAGASEEKGFTQIGKSENMFRGYLDGLEYSIKDLTIDKNANFMGLFYQTSKTAKVRNFTMDNVKVNGGSANGAVAGANQGLIENISIKGSVGGRKGINGGIVGINAGIIRNVSVDAVVTGGGTVLGGIAGQNQAAGTIDNVNVKGHIGNSTFDIMGGIVGDNAGLLNNVHNEATVVGRNAVSGIVGQNKATYTISNATNIGNITGQNYVGGIIGYYSNANDMLLKNSSNSGHIIGTSMVGGIVGSGGGAVIGGGGYEGCVSIENAQNSGDITGSSSVGGIMGGSGYTKLIDNVKNTGTVKGNSQVGGILGNTASGKVLEALNLGQVIGLIEDKTIGGIVGSGYDAYISDKAVYATTDKDGNAYDVSSYNDKGTGKTYVEIFPAPPEPPEPEPPVIHDDKQDITKLPEFEEHYHGSSSAIISDLHTTIRVVEPMGENKIGDASAIEVSYSGETRELTNNADNGFSDDVNKQVDANDHNDGNEQNDEENESI